MTKPHRCGWCGGVIDSAVPIGRPKRYCRQGCRQQAYLARRLAETHELGADEVVVRRSDLEALADSLYTLQAALEDVAVDLSDSERPEDVRRALDWLVEQATPVATVWITPVAGRGLE